MHNRKVVTPSDALTLESAAIPVTLFSAKKAPRPVMFRGVVAAHSSSINIVITMPEAEIGGVESENN